jgi:hypothetical protein
VENQKPKSVKAVGLLITIFSCFIIFSNFSGMLAGKMFEEMIYSDDFNAIDFILKNYTKMCALMIIVGLSFMVGGIYLRKFKLWAKKLLIVLSIMLILIIWSFMILLATNFWSPSFYRIYSLLFIVNAIIWSTPIVLLIRFLNKSQIKEHFA